MVGRGYQPDHVHTLTSSVKNSQGAGFRAEGFGKVLIALNVKMLIAQFFRNNVQMSENVLPRFS